MVKNEIQFALLVGSNSQDPTQPPSLLTYSDNLYPGLGRIIAQWALLEQEVHFLIHALLKHAGRRTPGWVRQPFNQRWKLLRKEWEVFAASELELVTEMTEIHTEMHRGKVVRDGIAHGRIRLGMNDEGQWVRFQSDNRTFPWTKRYYMPDLDDALGNINNAVGRLFRLMMLDYAKHFSPQSISLLQQLPDTAHLRFSKR
jgi:hypothetical protein